MNSRGLIEQLLDSTAGFPPPETDQFRDNYLLIHHYGWSPTTAIGNEMVSRAAGANARQVRSGAAFAEF